MTDLFTAIQDTDRHGETYDAKHDFDRLNRQQRAVYQVMMSGCWLTLRDISDASGAPEASVSARLRDLRNMFDMTIEKRRKPGFENSGIWEYRMLKGGA